MKIALIGASGYTGSKILTEALTRGHSLTAIVRNPDKLPQHSRLIGQKGDATNCDELVRLSAGHDVLISAFNPGKDATGTGSRSIIEATKRSRISRLIVVGGAGSLEIASGRRLVDEPDFPSQWKDGALKTATFLDLLRNEPELNWTFLSPAANLEPGERTGTYRLGGDRLLTDAGGVSRISTADLAVALLDEVERPQHNRRRFTVAY